MKLLIGTGVVEYSTDKQSWNTWDATEIASALSEGQHHLYMRGTGNTHICINSRDGRFIINGSNVSCIGNIENLLDYQSVLSGEQPQMGNNAFSYLFSNNSALISSPSLPSLNLSASCYSYMLQKTSIVEAPLLPAESVPDSSYYELCESCSKLERCSGIYATTLGAASCQRMFFNCPLLETLTEINVQNISIYTLSSMFGGCPKIRLSTTQIDDYQTPYRIPSRGTGTVSVNSLYLMFANTGGTFVGTPIINTTYYTSNEVIPAGGK